MELKVSKNIFLTGAGSGIGRSIALRLAKEGYSLILSGRKSKKLEKLLQDISSPNRHRIFPCDTRNTSSIRSALKQSGVESLYAVIANAGIGGENIYGENDRWQEIVDINLTGSYNTLNECLPYLEKDSNSFKKIIIISSILARLGVPGYSAYCASKAGLLGLTRSLAAEFSSKSILVNALCPGWVDTDMAHEGLDGMARSMNTSKVEAFNIAMSQVPLGKMSTPEEIASLASFLLSEAQNSITGQSLDINNGAIMP